MQYLFNKVPDRAGLQLLDWKETPTQMFSCENRKIFKNSFFKKTPPVAGSDKRTTLSSKHFLHFFTWFFYTWLLFTFLAKFLWIPTLQIICKRLLLSTQPTNSLNLQNLVCCTRSFVLDSLPLRRLCCQDIKRRRSIQGTA